MATWDRSSYQDARADEVGEPGDLVIGVPGREGEAQARRALGHSRGTDGDDQKPFVSQQTRGVERRPGLADDHRHDGACRLRQPRRA